MVDPNTLYRLRQRDRNRFDPISSAELMSMIFVTEKAAKPDNPQLVDAEWYCHNEDCDVREVRVHVKYLDGPAPKQPPPMKCPSCGEPMGFHHYLREVALVPHGKAEESPAGNMPSQADIQAAVEILKDFRADHEEQIAPYATRTAEVIEAAEKCNFLPYHRERIEECDRVLLLLASLQGAKLDGSPSTGNNGH
ncbi:MAG TPA: hypothetical protein VMG10_14390 [Gemmataceae bacterium]|nr:hypothetical protein [Gemmataceae bacterium]